VVGAASLKAEYLLQTTNAAESQLDMIRRLELRPESFGHLMAYCQERKILFLSSPFDEESADLLGELGIAAYRVPSGEITNLSLLGRLAPRVSRCRVHRHGVFERGGDGGNTGQILMNPITSLEIDTEVDFKIIEAILRCKGWAPHEGH
jgi:hypothetical protein